MGRLNSGNFGIFELSEWSSNLNNSVCRDSKFISNDIKLKPISWELKNENPFLSICVGVWVGGHPPTKFSYVSKDAQENFTSFDINDVTGGDRGNMVLNEKPTKNFK